ncbi:dihydrodipicolinate reductase [Actinomadura darangshiensis]|uniref:Dihydrodipicolinate reductase n=1 Tax=Actinomadura darangshiensis TaxID=705336 RepID=A0A4R5AC46_9ACTN|nr:dihydrodipicolinate reductase [Actinomadura darangshiensis]TDD68806.1 dihydrodipicolinate reductase [Actinomadura darangshiensis]
MSYLVGQWGTGTVGRRALGAIIGNPELELAGVVTGTVRDVGVDAAELAGAGRPLGVPATDDPAALLARRPHVVCHTASAGRDVAAELCRLLEAGIGVVSDVLPALVHPPSADRGLVRRLRSACATGGAACLTAGPGLVHDVLPLLLSGACLRIDGLKIAEFGRSEFAGFGDPVGHRPPMARPGTPRRTWGPVVRLLAEHLGVPLDDVCETYELCAAPEDIGRIAKGTIAGVRLQVSGLLRGRPVITVERVLRARADVAPHWPAAPFGEAGGHRVEIAGEPPWRLDVAGPGGAAALRMVSALPAVAEAPPGLHTPLTLPPLTGRRLLR